MRTLDLRAAAVAGLAGGVAYAVTAEIDNRISGRNLDDLKLLGRPFVRDSARAKLAGVPVHLANSTALAAVYARMGRRLPGGPVWRGVLFAVIENTLLYPVAALENRHPGVRDGQVDRYFSVSAYLLSLPRHVVYGGTLGLLYDRLGRDSAGGRSS